MISMPKGTWTVTTVVLFCSWLGAESSDDYDILKSIPSPYQMIDPHFPAEYRADVELSGKVANEMKKTLEKMDYPPPRYEEIRAKGEGFNLALSNPEYPVETRDLISGILNPTEMTESLLSSILKYRDPQKFASLRKETRSRRKIIKHQGKTCYEITLEPTGKRFSYIYEDMGSYIREFWLSELTVVVDTSDNVIQELSLKKHSRHIAANASKEPSVQTRNFEYLFDYKKVQGALLPHDLHVNIDGTESVSLKTTYHKTKKHLMFEKRTICYRKPSKKTSCLEMKYGTIHEGKGSAKSVSTRTRAGGKDLMRAAKLSRKATDALKEGTFSVAVRALQKIIDEYPETPQAVEARKLLSTLPY